jgi:hypothetical protein
MSALAGTVISFDDGSTYTLEDNQEIYISNETSTLFKRRILKNKDTYFYAQEPWDKRDHVPGPTDDLEVGSHEWCKAYIPWSEGLTFNMVAWQRACDTNRDGVYNEDDNGWEE